MKSWIKGGLIGAGIGLILTLFTLITKTDIGDIIGLEGMFYNRFFIIFDYPCYAIFGQDPFTCLYAPFLINAIIGSLIGTLISYLVRRKQ